MITLYMYLHVWFNIACQAKVRYQNATAICCWHFWKKGEGTVYPTLHGRSGLDVLKFLRITDALFQHQVFRSWWLQRILDNLKFILPWKSNEIPIPMKDHERACLNMLDAFLKTYIYTIMIKYHNESHNSNSCKRQVVQDAFESCTCIHSHPGVDRIWKNPTILTKTGISLNIPYSISGWLQSYMHFHHKLFLSQVRSRSHGWQLRNWGNLQPWIL